MNPEELELEYKIHQLQLELNYNVNCDKYYWENDIPVKHTKRSWEITKELLELKGANT